MGEIKSERAYEECPLLMQSPKKLKATQTKQPATSTPTKPTRRTVGRSFSFCCGKSPVRRNHRKVHKSSRPRPSLGFLSEFRSAHGNRGSNRKLPCGDAALEDNNVMEWLSFGCPEDVVSHILAFSGPQTVACLSRVNCHWNSVTKSQETWRVLCEDLYKWKKGDKRPVCWKQLYIENPCVPVDYPSISSALKVPRQCVLVRPGTYHMPRAVSVDNGNHVLIEQMELPEALYRSATNAVEVLESFQAAFKDGLSCPDLMDDSSLSEYSDMVDTVSDVVLISQAGKRRNEPLFRVSNGSLTIRNIQMQHESMGIDIWGGNAAIQVELSDTGMATKSTAASVTLDCCEVTSSSGRGIVVVAGGYLETRNCHVHSCAATGVYVGGETSRARLVATDVTTNGLGNQHTGGIARGHSGIYLEHGRLDVIDSNVSLNSASGISVVAPGERRLSLKNTDLVGNGVMPIDVPFGVEEDDAVFELLRNSSELGNRMLPHGSYRTRSSLVPDMPPVISHTDFEEYH